MNETHEALVKACRGVIDHYSGRARILNQRRKHLGKSERADLDAWETMEKLVIAAEKHMADLPEEEKVREADETPTDPPTED